MDVADADTAALVQELAMAATRVLVILLPHQWATAQAEITILCPAITQDLVQVILVCISKKPVEPASLAITKGTRG
jgi:hypothetical protein